MLALDGGPPVRGERVALGDDLTQIPALTRAVLVHAGVGSEMVARPLVGVALLLPAWADAGQVARAIDAEQVTAGFLDFEGRACVALPADPGHIEQAAHAVAKVVHLLLEIHTDFINGESDACPLPPMLETDADQAAVVVLDAVGQLAEALATWRHVAAPPPNLAGLVAEGMATLRELME